MWIKKCTQIITDIQCTCNDSQHNQSKINPNSIENSYIN